MKQSLPITLSLRIFIAFNFFENIERINKRNIE